MISLDRIEKTVDLEALKLLEDDNLYYGEYGKQWMSASTLKKYLHTDCPIDEPMNELALLLGHAFHQAVLEPEKFETRDDLSFLHRHRIIMMRNHMVNSEYYRIMDNVTSVEKPYIGEISGIPFKCKVDAETDDYLIDLKTTSGLSGLDYTSRRFGYHISAYVYWALTGKLMKFLYIDKKSYRVRLIEADERFYKDGHRDFCWALRNYKESLKKHWAFMGSCDLDDGRYLVDDVHIKVVDGSSYSWIYKDEYLRKRR